MAYTLYVEPQIWGKFKSKEIKTIKAQLSEFDGSLKIELTEKDYNKYSAEIKDTYVILTNPEPRVRILGS
jgi:hypothetical protein